MRRAIRFFSASARSRAAREAVSRSRKMKNAVTSPPKITPSVAVMEKRENASHSVSAAARLRPFTRTTSTVPTNDATTTASSCTTGLGTRPDGRFPATETASMMVKPTTCPETSRSRNGFSMWRPHFTKATITVATTKVIVARRQLMPASRFAIAEIIRVPAPHQA